MIASPHALGRQADLSAEGTPCVPRATGTGWLALLFLVACKSGSSDASRADASAVSAPAPTTLEAASPEAAAPPPSDAAADATPPPVDAELTLHVQGGYCPAARQSAPECRSYTYVLRGDGTLRGARRKSAVPAAEVLALFSLAEAAFSGKHVCIPNGPDRGSQAITLRESGKPRVASGGCGPRFEELKARLERLAAQE